jgi:thioredoxin reductase (NADPH)
MRCLVGFDYTRLMPSPGAVKNTYDLVIAGAGPGGIALAAEAQACALDRTRTIVLEKGTNHNWAIRQFYPEQKLTTANYKGFQARCEGLLCIRDMTKSETLEYFDRIIADYKLQIQYETEVSKARRVETESGARFIVETSRGLYESKVLAVAIGILGRPNKPKEYPLPGSLKERLLFDITSRSIRNEDVLIVGGGDTAAEYCDYLHREQNRVTLSYRRAEFTRLNERNRTTLLGLEQRGDVRILRTSNITRIEVDGNRPRVVFNEGNYPPETFDRVVYALGGSTPSNFLRTLGIEFNDEGPLFNSSGETNVPGLFVLGDLVVGQKGGSIITAFNSAVHAMRRMCDAYLTCGPCGPENTL